MPKTPKRLQATCPAQSIAYDQTLRPPRQKCLNPPPNDLAGVDAGQLEPKVYIDAHKMSIFIDLLEIGSFRVIG